MDLGRDLYWYIKDIGRSYVIVKKISSTLINDCADTTIQEQTGFLTTDFDLIDSKYLVTPSSKKQAFPSFIL